MRRLLVAVALLALAAGCSSTTSNDSGQSGQSIAAQQQSDGAIVPGYTVSIPKLNETSTLQGLSLNADRTIQVPSLADPMQAGIYTKGPMPGQVGPAVVLAHVNAGGHPGFGAGFRTLAAGDLVNFTTPTGPASYRVTRTQTIPKADFPTAAVYGDVDHAALRLLTCGGELDQSAHNYLSQVVVYADRA